MILLLLAGGVFFNRVAIKGLILDWQKPELPKAIEYSVIASEAASLADEAKQSQNQDGIAEPVPSIPEGVAREFTPSMPEGLPRNDSIIPLEYNLDVPFQPQAPRADWNLPYQEACEEASLIMAGRFFSGRGLTVDEMDKSIKDLVEWERKRFGYYEDTTVAEVVSIAQEYFNLNASLDYDVSAENIKKHISQNKLVLVPAAGKILPNPYFKNGGPLYHMLVIRGYIQDKFITNDPGTKRGKEFVYKYNDLLNAVHAWPRETGGSKRDVSEAEMLQGEKVMIVVDKRN